MEKTHQRLTRNGLGYLGPTEFEINIKLYHTTLYLKS